jgi:hypothetical protein
MYIDTARGHDIKIYFTEYRPIIYLPTLNSETEGT